MGENRLEIVEQHEQRTYALTTRLISQIVEKNYLTNLNKLAALPLNEFEDSGLLHQVRMFKITEIIFQEHENITQKITNVYNALSVNQNSVFLILDATEQQINLYIGVRQIDPQNSIMTTAALLQKALSSQFPGIRLKSTGNAEIRQLQDNIQAQSNIAVASGIPRIKSKESRDNQHFIQGLEKFIDSLQGETYQAVILANSVSKNEINEIRRQSEEIYTKLAPLKKKSRTWGMNSSNSTTKSRSTSQSSGTSASNGQTQSVSAGDSKTTSETISKPTARAIQADKINGIVASAASISLTNRTNLGGICTPLGMVNQGITKMIGTDAASRETESNGETTGTSKTETNGSSVTHGTSKSTSKGITKGTANQTGTSDSLVAEFEDKTISNMLAKLDFQFKRLDNFDDSSAWQTAAYFMSDQPDVVEIAAATYQSLMSGENSGIQNSAVNSWLASNDSSLLMKDSKINIIQSIANFIHPKFVFTEMVNQDVWLDASSIVSSTELALQAGLPRHSVVGLPVIKRPRFARSIEVEGLRLENTEEIRLGRIANEVQLKSRTPVALNLASLSGHTFVTGATGSGKSNTVYQLLTQALEHNLKFLVVEPAKGEYKHIFGNRDDVTVYGTNANYTELLRINPFSFPSEIHLYEHVDRLVEILNISWGLYAAMPALLKKAILLAYEQCGWDVIHSTNYYSATLFPNFKDVLNCLRKVINESDYSGEARGNYIGSLVTRAETLTNGLNGEIFNSQEVNNASLFDQNVIIDLSRVGSTETKSLIMGILIIRLNEYRMSCATGMNAKLRHLTVLEEAHNILSNSNQSANTDGGGSVTGKSVELISNSIAEMRTYGEGFIIVDQSPAAVDMAAIRNTNTKIIMRLPEYTDRELVGKAAAVNEHQLNEIAKLPKGTAVVYQNDWLEPVLVSVDLAQLNATKRQIYQYEPTVISDITKKEAIVLLTKMAINQFSMADDLTIIKENLPKLSLSGHSQRIVYQLLNHLYSIEQVEQQERVRLLKELYQLDDKTVYQLTSIERIKWYQKRIKSVVNNQVDSSAIIYLIMNNK